MRIPFFHYTILESLQDILTEGRLVSRCSLVNKRKKFTDISIDPAQTTRESMGLTKYIPMFAGFYELFRDYEFNGYLMENYDSPKVQNKSFYGTLHKVLKNSLGENYPNVIIFMINDEHIYNSSDKGNLRFFSDIAIKNEAFEICIKNRKELQSFLEFFTDGTNISGEVDILDDGNTSISCMSDIEALIVDNDEIQKQVQKILDKCNKSCQIFVNSLPRC